MALLFARCTRCGGLVEDETALMAARHFPWECPLCGKENPPLGKSARQDRVEPEDEEEMVADGHGLTGEGELLFRLGE